MSNCVYCNKEIEKGRLRCETCNKAWKEGVDFGKKAFSYELKDILNELNKLVGDTFK